MKKLVRRTIKVKNTLDTRQIAYLVQCAGQFKSDIRIEEDEKFINAKSIMGMMALGLVPGQTVKVSADGADEAQAIESIEKYLGNKN